MTFFWKRRERRATEAKVRKEADLARIRRGIADARAMYGTPEGDFDLRAMTLELYDGAPTPSLRLIKQDMTERERGALDFYEEELARLWEGAGREERRAALEREIELSDHLRSAVASKARAGRHIVVACALSDAKASALACAFDATYGTDYSERMFVGHRG